MRRISLTWALALVIGLLPCTLAATSRHSGIVGQVLIDAGCPVITPDRDCSDRPYQTSISVYSSTRRLIAKVATDENGRFRMRLKHGKYTLVPYVSDSFFPHATPVEVVVRRKTFTFVTIRYDTGIR